jgi:ubiquinone biosynthesis protein
MQYIKGLKLSKIISDEYNSEKYPVRKDNLIETISGSLMDQMFIHGMLHADPHPGNFIITEDGKLYFIDFGRVNHLDYELQTFLLEYMISLAKRDPEMITEIISENFGLRRRDTYADDIRFIFTKYYGRTLGRMDMGELMVDSFNISRKHRVRLPAQVFLMSRIIVLIEGIGSRLDPDFSYVNFLKDYFSRRTMIDVVKERMTEMRRESVWNMVMLPRKLKSVERLVTGNKKINIKLPKIERLLDKFNHSLNALAVAVIMAGLLISVNKFQYPLIPQIVLMILGVYIIYQLMFKNK